MEIKIKQIVYDNDKYHTLFYLMNEIYLLFY